MRIYNQSTATQVHKLEDVVRAQGEAIKQLLHSGGSSQSVRVEEQKMGILERLGLMNA